MTNEQTRADFEAWLNKPIKHGKSLAETLDTPQKVIAENTWADAWYTATLAERERLTDSLEAYAIDLSEAMTKRKTLGEKHNSITIGQIEVLRAVVAAIRQGTGGNHG